MRKILLAAATALAIALPASAQEEPEGAPSPNQIVDTARAEEWVTIGPEDLLVMTLAPDADGNEREVVIQLMPAPFSQGWIENIRTLARAEWYDGISVNRVQDNYVVQWGDPGYDNPESGDNETKPLPDGLKVMGQEDYSIAAIDLPRRNINLASLLDSCPEGETCKVGSLPHNVRTGLGSLLKRRLELEDPYATYGLFNSGWPLGYFGPKAKAFPVHCYGMVGVGRNYSPDTGTGAELYTVIGHAPRHLDRNIALVGRIINGMEHLSSLPRGSGTLGFYTEEEADKRTPILSIRVVSDLPKSEQLSYEYLSTEGETFARYAEARANRRDPFFIHPAGGADICNIPVPIRAIGTE